MRCNNCGFNNLGPDDTYCPKCGARVYSPNRSLDNRPSGNTSSGFPGDAPRPKSGNNGWMIITLAVIVALAIIGGALYMGLSHQDEETMWAQCEQSHELSDYKKYIDAYPEGEHSAEARHMYTLLINEKTMWEQVQSSNDEFQLRSFINSHPNSKYLGKAREMLDDAVWNNAVEKNTRQDFERYMREFPSGKHIGEARSRFEEFRRAELTVDERDQVKALVQQFLSGLEQWSLASMTMSCNTSMTNFMGKHSATHNDVREFFNAYRDAGIDSISFSSLAVDVAKSLDSNRLPRYSANFTVTRRFWRGQDMPNTSMMRGNAVVDNYFKFDEFSLDKVADN